MARKPKGQAPKADAPPPAQVTYEMTSKDALTKLLRGIKSLEKQGLEISGSLREKIAYAVEKQHLHKGVFALIRQLDRKEAEQLALWKATFDHYWEASGLQERAESTPGLDLEDEQKEDAGAEPSANVRQLRPNGQAAEIG